MTDLMLARHLVAPITHYTPEPNGPSVSRRVAVCGVSTRIAGPYQSPANAAGSSRLAHVTCCACLDVVEARKSIWEAGE